MFFFLKKKEEEEEEEEWVWILKDLIASMNIQ
jgi:hypothetical protein